MLLAAVTLTSLNVFQTSMGPHDGIVKKAENYNIEMKSSYGNFYAYLLDEKCKPLSNKKIFCEVRFFYPDKTSADIQLKPFGSDGFTIASTVIEFYSCKITFNVLGKSVVAKFENENQIVERK